jgi:hypothetical protein
LAHLRSMRYIGIRSLPDEAIWRFSIIYITQRGPGTSQNKKQIDTSKHKSETNRCV